MTPMPDLDLMVLSTEEFHQLEQELVEQKTFCEGWYQTARERAKTIIRLGSRTEQLEQWLLAEQKATRAVAQTVRDREAKISQLEQELKHAGGACMMPDPEQIARISQLAAEIRQSKEDLREAQSQRDSYYRLRNREEWRVVILTAENAKLEQTVAAHNRVTQAARKVIRVYPAHTSISCSMSDLSDALESLDAQPKEATA